jgi:hypothetical protein
MFIITINWNLMNWKPISPIKVVVKSLEIAFMIVSLETELTPREALSRRTFVASSIPLLTKFQQIEFLKDSSIRDPETN